MVPRVSRRANPVTPPPFAETGLVCSTRVGPRFGSRLEPRRRSWFARRRRRPPRLHATACVPSLPAPSPHPGVRIFTDVPCRASRSYWILPSALCSWNCAQYALLLCCNTSLHPADVLATGRACRAARARPKRTSATAAIAKSVRPAPPRCVANTTLGMPDPCAVRVVAHFHALARENLELDRRPVAETRVEALPTYGRSR